MFLCNKERRATLYFRPSRRRNGLRSWRRATLNHDTDPLLAEFAGAQLIVPFGATRTFRTAGGMFTRCGWFKHSLCSDSKPPHRLCRSGKQWEENFEEC